MPRALAAERAGSHALDAANDAWDRGDYIAALNGYIQILAAPGGDAALEVDCAARPASSFRRAS